jgi:hypothetical protein
MIDLCFLFVNPDEFAVPADTPPPETMQRPRPSRGASPSSSRALSAIAGAFENGQANRQNLGTRVSVVRARLFAAGSITRIRLPSRSLHRIDSWVKVKPPYEWRLRADGSPEVGAGVALRLKSAPSTWLSPPLATDKVTASAHPTVISLICDQSVASIAWLIILGVVMSA